MMRQDITIGDVKQVDESKETERQSWDLQDMKSGDTVQVSRNRKSKMTTPERKSRRLENYA